MWDDNFTTDKKKFELGRVITRDEASQLTRDLLQIELEKKENYERGRIIRTTNIDAFLHCDDDYKDHIVKKD